MGEKWNRHHRQFESMIAPVGNALIESCAFRPGEQVVDIGCGAGATSFDIARRVGPQGRVTGVDISRTLVTTAARRAREAGIGNCEFIEADATTYAFKAEADAVFSRFGVMFFDDAYAAFANLRRALRPGGRLQFACWGPMPENPWVQEMMGVLARHVELPKPVPRAPSPFAFAETEYVQDILGRAGLRDIAFSAWRGWQLVGGAGANAAQAAQFLMDAASAGDALADQPQQLKDRVRVDLEQMLTRFDGPEGVRTPAMAWIVSARA